MVNKEFVEQYVKDQIDKHEADFTKYGWKALCLFVLNEVFLLWLIFNK